MEDNTHEEVKQENTTQEQTEQAPNVSQENEVNWKKFREERERERKAAQEAKKQAEETERSLKQKEEEARAMKEALEALINKKKDYYDDDDEDNEEKNLEKLLEQKLAERDRKAEEKRRQEEAAQMPLKLKQAYSDFDRVCTAENLDYLEYHYPELAKPFAQMPDSFDKWTSVYKAVKRFVPNTNSPKDQKRIEKNLSSPQSSSSPGRTSTGDSAPMILDEKTRMENWKRMQAVMKGLS